MADTAGHAPGRVVVAGASGLIGGALIASLEADGVPVTRLVRRPAESPDEVEWDPTRSRLDPAVLDGARAVVGLNGASIGRFPWSRRYKHALVWSRIAPTQALAAAVRALGADAPAFVSASAVGYYPTHPGEALTESGPQGDGFLAELTGEWEHAARTAGENVAVLRTAPIVHPEGVLKPLMLLTRAGLSGPIGRGTQVWPWISLPDEVRAIRHVIDTGITGPVNLSGPTRATANDLGFALAMRMNRPYLLRAPVWGMELVLGREPVQALLACDLEVVPQVLTSSGFRFTHPTVKDAVADAVPAAA
ncbi:TIGR01777 family oxidoreductase [Microbacterium sp. W1N]|uniref:TIGR01777 family oxidoreductase n=1 Tax=Microbacterium festucae TaxID=2977531 RepID=UPI0021BE266A|nr:TIGR01777 family oxidoreductase [Microbacterium festucae]MCT9821514.1 TIGR01777 family oxidoreductase [Microbacterium festucae]